MIHSHASGQSVLDLPVNVQAFVHGVRVFEGQGLQVLPGDLEAVLSRLKGNEMRFDAIQVIRPYVCESIAEGVEVYELYHSTFAREGLTWLVLDERSLISQLELDTERTKAIAEAVSRLQQQYEAFQSLCTCSQCRSKGKEQLS
jgi:hypothetical protein